MTARSYHHNSNLAVFTPTSYTWGAKSSTKLLSCKAVAPIHPTISCWIQILNAKIDTFIRSAYRCFKQWLLVMLQADEEDWVWTTVGNRGGQGDDAQPDRGLPHGPLPGPSPAAAPA